MPVCGRSTVQNAPHNSLTLKLENVMIFDVLHVFGMLIFVVMVVVSFYQLAEFIFIFFT